MDMNELKSAVLHGLLSATDMFLGKYKEFTYITANSQGNGYLALYQILHLTHTLLGQVTTQNEHP
jgi:hypothetical protein